MPIPDWRHLVMEEGVLAEPAMETGLLMLWLRAGRDQDFQHWQRAGNVARAVVYTDAGLGWTAATVVPCRQPLVGLLGRFARWFGNYEDKQTWLLPNGETVEQSGERHTDCLLAWSDDPARPLDLARIKSRWPQSSRQQKLANNLFLIAGVPLEEGYGIPAPAPLEAQARGGAEHWLADARQKGDRHQELAALADLGVFAYREGDFWRALPSLEEALGLARQLGDRPREGDVLGHLGLVVLHLGDRNRGSDLVDLELKIARTSGDRFALKTALHHTGLARMLRGEYNSALALGEESLALAEELGDRPHNAELHWFVALQHAELGQREQAVTQGQAAVDVYRQLGRAEAGSYAEYLRQYVEEETACRLGGPVSGEKGVPAPDGSGVIVASQWSPIPAIPAVPQQESRGAGLLRMAMSAAAAAAKFVGSGLKTVPAEVQNERLRACAACEHHTGLRCKLCGCFTNTKAWLPHEACPIGKWRG